MPYLGIDLGTSGLRALLISEKGVPVGATECKYGMINAHPGWSEQDPATWITALESAIGELRRSNPSFRDIKGIGVAGHMHGATLLDASGQVLRPCILWNDTRAEPQAKRLNAIKEMRQVSGNIVFPGFTAPKLDWVRENEPKIFARTAKVLLPAAYLNFYLTGDYVADMSDSSGTSWFDVAQRNWSDQLLDTGQMRRDQMPRLVEGSEKAGTLRRELIGDWGLTGPVTVAGGAGDNAAAACGIGTIQEGSGFVSLGTSGAILTGREKYQPAPDTAVHTFAHAVPGRWYQMGVMLSAAGSLDWLSGIAGTKQSELTSTLGDRLVPPGPVRFLPYLSGERTPHNDAQIRGAFTGLSASTSRDELTRAILEGVAFALRDNLEALSATGAKPERLTAIGGGTGSHYWLKLISSVLRTPLDLPSSGEFGAALGAARLGMASTEIIPLENIMTPPKIRETVRPDRILAASFDDAFQSFREAYPAIKSIQ